MQLQPTGHHPGSVFQRFSRHLPVNPGSLQASPTLPVPGSHWFGRSRSGDTSPWCKSHLEFLLEHPSGTRALIPPGAHGTLQAESPPCLPHAARMVPHSPSRAPEEEEGSSSWMEARRTPPRVSEEEQGHGKMSRLNPWEGRKLPENEGSSEIKINPKLQELPLPHPLGRGCKGQGWSQGGRKFPGAGEGHSGAG